MLLRWFGDIRDDGVRDFGDFFEWKFFWYCFFDNKFSKQEKIFQKWMFYDWNEHKRVYNQGFEECIYIKAENFGAPSNIDQHT